MNNKDFKSKLANKTCKFLDSLAKTANSSYSFVGPYDPRNTKKVNNR